MKKPKGKYVRKEQQSKSDNQKAKLKRSDRKIDTIQKTAETNTKTYIWLIIISIVTFVAYLPTFENEATNWDDDQYISENPFLKELNAETVKDIFFSDIKKERYWMGNYHPLTMLSLSVNYAITGEDKDGKVVLWSFHLTNILLHIISTLLVFWLVSVLLNNFYVAVITALLFGVHTIHVESVTWLSERKDVLYTVFFLASLLTYIKYIVHNKKRFYLFSILFMWLSLLSKGQAVSLAVTLFVIDYFKDRNFKNYMLWIEKIPYLALAVIFGIIAIQAQKAGLALQDITHYSFIKRIGFAGYGFSQYLIKLAVPINLSAIYPYPDIINKGIPAYYWIYAFVSFIIGLSTFYFWKRNKFIAFGLLFFIVNIALLLQLIPVGSAVYADRYAYIPSIGIFIIMAYGVYYLIRNKYSKNKKLIYGIVGTYIVVLGILTFQQTQVWKTSLSLWNKVVSSEPKAVVAWNNRGSEKNRVANAKYKEKNDQKFIELKRSAIKDFTNAIELKPDYAHAFFNRGAAKRDIGEILNDTVLILSAIEDFEQAILYDLNFSEAFHNRALAYDLLGEFKKAEKDFSRAIELDPENFEIYINRGVTYGKRGFLKKAVADFNYVLEKQPDNATAYSNRGLAKNGLNDFEGALSDFNKALNLNPEMSNPYFNRAITYRRLNKYDLAIKDLTKLISIRPDNSNAYYLRAMDYINMGNIDQACIDLNTALQMNHPMARKQIDKYCN